MKRAKPWPLSRLLADNRNAGTVVLAVFTLACGRRQVSTIRSRIGELCGLSARTIGEAVDALHRAGWLRRAYGRRNGKAWYRLSLPKALDALCVEKQHTGSRPKVSKNDTQGRRPCGTKNDTPSPRGEAGGPTAPALEGAGAARPDPMPEHPSARIERERLAEIRAAREAEERQAECAGELRRAAEALTPDENPGKRLA